MPIDVAADVIANLPLSADYNVLALAAPAIAAASAPGQFVMIKANTGPGLLGGNDPLLRRPFSVFEILRGAVGDHAHLARGKAARETTLMKRIDRLLPVVTGCRKREPPPAFSFGPCA